MKKIGKKVEKGFEKRGKISYNRRCALSVDFGRFAFARRVRRERRPVGIMEARLFRRDPDVLDDVASVFPTLFLIYLFGRFRRLGDFRRLRRATRPARVAANRIASLI